MPNHRVALVIHSLDGGGAERQLATLANHYSAQGHSVTLITLDSAQSDRYPLEARIERIGLGLMSVSRNKLHALLSNRQRVRAIRNAIVDSRADCVISFTDKMNIVTLSACRHLQVPVVICERSDPRKQQLGPIWDFWRRRVYPRCTECVALTPSIANYLRPLVRGKPVTVIPSAIDPPQTSFSNSDVAKPAQHSALRLIEKTPVRTLLAVGRLSQEKGFDRLLNAWVTASRQLVGWQLGIVGDGPLREGLGGLARELGIEDRVVWFGWQSDIWSTLKKADAFVLSSRYEGFPQSLLEAMAVGLPVIAVDCTDAIEMIIEHEKTGWIVRQSADGQLLADALMHVLNDQRLCDSMAQQGQKSVQRFTWPVISKSWDAVMERALSASLDRRR